MAYFEAKKLPPISTPTVTGSIVTFNSQYAGLPLKSHVVDIDYTGSAISGVNVYARGINLWDEEWENGYWNVVNAQPVVNYSYIRCKNYIRVLPNTTYCLANTATTIYKNEVLYFDADKNYLTDYDDVKGGETFTTLPNCYYIKFYMNINYGTTYNSDISINYPATDTDYHAFEGQSYNITFPTPIYGGSYDCLTGIVTSNKDSGGGDITPTYQQTATANCVTSLGVNNIIADTGDTTLQYIKLG